MSVLNTTAMAEAIEVYLGAYEHASSFYAKDSAAIKFMSDLGTTSVPYAMVSPDGISGLASAVFGNKEVRDFISLLSFQFYSRWGYDQQHVDALCQALARGATMGVMADKDRAPNSLFDPTVQAMPLDIRSRMVDQHLASQVIISNQWMVVLLMHVLASTLGRVQPVRSDR